MDDHEKLRQELRRKFEYRRSGAKKVTLFTLSLMFFAMLVISVLISTEVFAQQENDKMVLISICMIGLSCLFGCGVYSFSLR